MRRFARAWAMGMAITALVMAGCKSKKQAATQPSMAMAADMRTVRMTEESFRQVDPQANVGMVLAVLPDRRLAAIGDVDVKPFHEGDAVTFIDTQRNTIGNGRVVNIVDGFVHVKYEPPGPGHRAPHEGDMAVRFSH